MYETLPAYRLEATLQQDGIRTLEHLPFRAGPRVEVIVLQRPSAPELDDPYPLRGTPVHYERPFAPAVPPEDWDALQ